MIDLTNSGLPLQMSEETYRITMGEGLKSDGYSRKLTGQMAGLLADETGLEDLAGEPFYDVYRGIAFPEDEPLLRKYNFRYDITVIMPGDVNGECRKTSGHYHGRTPEGRHSYAEVYEVLKGTALYVLQKSPDFDSPDPGQAHIEDVILVTVPEGKTLLVPPDYGHCSVNIGEGPLVFSNLAYVDCPIHYDPVRSSHGMSRYAFRDESGIVLKRNPHEQDAPEPRFAEVRENPSFGITWEEPVYSSFRRNPEAFDFLAHPDPYTERIMEMLDFQDGWNP